MNTKTVHIILSNEAEDFVRSQPVCVQQKIAYNIRKIEIGIMDKELFKKLDGSDIWEIRTLVNRNCYRLFAFWDTETQALIVATHGIVKKTQKTPQKEIDKAKKIRTIYLNSKIQ